MKVSHKKIKNATRNYYGALGGLAKAEPGRNTDAPRWGNKRKAIALLKKRARKVERAILKRSTDTGD